MSEIDYIGADELVFNNDVNEGIHSGGFDVRSIMLKSGMSPIMTVNTDQIAGGGEKVSDLFNNLVVPNWTLSYNNRIVGGKYKDKASLKEEDSDSDDDVVDDDLHDKLLDLVKQHENLNKKVGKKTRRQISKKNGTKRKKTKLQ